MGDDDYLTDASRYILGPVAAGLICLHGNKPESCKDDVCQRDAAIMVMLNRRKAARRKR